METRIDLEEFKNHLEGKGMAEKSIELYLAKLRRIDQLTKDVSNPAQVLRDINNSGIKKTARPIYKIVLRQYYSYLGRNDWRDLIDVGKKASSPIYWLSTKQVRRLIDVCKDDNERFIASFYFYTGTRVSIGLNLRIRDIHLDEMRINVLGNITGNKRKKQFSIYYPSELNDILKRWIKKEKLKLDDFLMKKFRLKWRYPENSFNHMFKRLAKKAGLPDWLSTHKLRHSNATYLNEKGVDLKAIQSNLGHSNIQSTMIYTHLSDKKRGKMIGDAFKEFK